jgi:hypothetical protein
MTSLFATGRATTSVNVWPREAIEGTTSGKSWRRGSM